MLVAHRGTGRGVAEAAFVLDLTPFKHTLIERDDLHEIAQRIKAVEAIMKSWTDGRRLKINTVTQGEVDARNREFMEARRAQRAARTEASAASEEPQPS